MLTSAILAIVSSEGKSATAFDGEAQEYAKHVAIVVTHGLATLGSAMLVKAASDAIELVQDLDAVFGRDVVRWRLAEVRAAMVAGEIRGLVRFRHLARLPRHLFERRNAVLGVGVRREPVVDTPPGKRVDDEHLRGGRNAFRGLIGYSLREFWILASADASPSGCPLMMAPSGLRSILASG